eukprot:1250597-Pyramimonas_sp.AAC.1
MRDIPAHGTGGHCRALAATVDMPRAQRCTASAALNHPRVQAPLSKGPYTMARQTRTLERLQ